MQVTRTVLVGARARERLLLPDFAASVIAAVSRAVYLQDQGGEILWISPPDSVPHRRCILASPAQSSCRVGTACGVRAGLLYIGDGLAIEWDRAVPWTGEGCGRACLAPEEAAGALRAGLALLSRRRQPAGLARIVLGGPRGSDLLPWPISVRERWLDAAGHLVECVVDSERARDLDELFVAARRLVGLGEGLTPSGDDFLGGFLFTRRHLERSDPATAWVDWDAWGRFLAEAAPLTNAISLALLSDLAEGHGPEPLHDLVCEALGRGSEALIAQHAARLVEIGGSSGWDLLAGVAAAMGVSAFGEPPLEPAPADREGRACSVGT